MPLDSTPQSKGAVIQHGRRRTLQYVGLCVLSTATAGCLDQIVDGDPNGTSGADDEDDGVEETDDDDETDTRQDGGEEQTDEGEPDIEVTDAVIDETTVMEGEEIEVTATVHNDGDARGEFVATLVLGGEEVADGSVTVDPDEEDTVTITTTVNEPGEYEVAVEDKATEPLTVEPKPPEFEVRDATVETQSATAGESIDVTATVVNTGGEEGTFAADLQVDESTVDTAEVTVGPDAQEAVSFTHTFADRGTYDVTVNDVGAGSVSVTACDLAFEETVTVDTDSPMNVDIEMGADASVDVLTRTQEGANPVVDVVDPTGETLIDVGPDNPLRANFEATVDGRYHFTFENTSLRPWNDGTWLIEIEVCSTQPVDVVN